MGNGMRVRGKPTEGFEKTEGLMRYLYRLPLSISFPSRRGGVAPGHAGAHAALRRVARFN